MNMLDEEREYCFGLCRCAILQLFALCKLLGLLTVSTLSWESFCH